MLMKCQANLKKFHNLSQAIRRTPLPKFFTLINLIWQSQNFIKKSNFLKYLFHFRLPADSNKKIFFSLRATSSARPNQGKNPKKNLALFPNFISFRPPQSTPSEKV